MAGRPALIARKQKKARSTRSEQYLVNEKYLGAEPSFDLRKEITQIEYSKALSWYNYMCTTEDAREYINEYLSFSERKIALSKLKSVPDVHINTTSGWIARMLMEGVLLPETSMAFFERKLEEMLAHTKQKPATIIKFNIQDRIREKTDDLIGEIESFLDIGENFSLYDYLKKNEIPSTYCQPIIDKYSMLLEELLDALEGNDEQVVEAYSHIKKKEIEKKVLFVNELISDAEKYGSNVKKTRKVSKPRPVKIEKVIKDFKYQKEFNDMKLASIKPEKIIGASELWTYNTKYKTLTVFRALDRAGLNIKGASIINFDEKNSTGKSTGRKNEEYVKKVLTGGKIVLRKIFDDIKTAVVFSNRIGENTILLKVS